MLPRKVACWTSEWPKSKRNRLRLGAGDQTRNCFVRKSRTQSLLSVRLEMGPAFVCRGSPQRNRHAPVASAGTGDVLARKTHAKSPSSGCLKIMPKSDVRGRPKRNRNSPAAGNATGEFFLRKSHAKLPFSGRKRNSPVGPKGDRRVFLEEVPSGIAILRSSPHLAIIILKGMTGEPENRDSA